MIFFLFYFVLGLVQGLTEFLPVSSSGHLVLVSKLFGMQQNSLFLSVLLHVATLLAVLIVLRKEIWQLVCHPFSKQTLLYVVATMPTILIVIIFKGFFESTFSGDFLPICFMITAVLLVVTSLYSKNKKGKDITYKNAIIMGISQGIAVLPGISRSGATICAGLLSGSDKKQTTKFSFIMSIPIIICSLVYEVYNCITSGVEFFSGSVWLVVMSFVVAFVSGIFAIKCMLKIVEKGKYYYFSVYLVVVAIISFFI